MEERRATERGRPGEPRTSGQELGTGFNKARRRVFLETLARTCNVQASCRAAEISDVAVYRRRSLDEEFRAEWEATLAFGLADLELVLLERAKREKPATEENQSGELLDPDLAKYLWKEGRNRPARESRRGRKPAAVEWQEVEDWFVAKMKIVKRRLARQKSRKVTK